jgi:hypothetical protein
MAPNVKWATLAAAVTICSSSGYPVYGDEKEMKDERPHMHGPAGMTPGKLAARSLLLCAHIYTFPKLRGCSKPTRPFTQFFGFPV